jgi:mannose-6-phosphate isomerase-like protein (cupin superfamily)
MVTCEVAFMTDPREAPFGAVLLADVVRATDIDPDYPDATDGDFHLIRRHFDIRAFGVNGITGDAGHEMVEPHHERDDELNRTDGHEELFAVMSGHAVFTVGGEAVDAPAGTLVFVRDPGLVRSARATVDGTAILAIGGRPGVAYGISRWESDLP